METSENPAPFIQHVPSKLAEAFAKAQGQFRTPKLNRTAKIKNSAGALLYETNYADLEECIDCIKKPLSENGLSFVQTIEFVLHPKEMWVLKLILRHSGGELMHSILPLNVTSTPQQLGGSLTYFKRYQLSAFFGLAADFDDDGNAAEGKGNKVESDAKPENKPPKQPQSNSRPQTQSTNVPKSGNIHSPGPTLVPQKTENKSVGKITVGVYTGKYFDEVLKLDSAVEYKLARWAHGEMSEFKNINPCYLDYVAYAISEGVLLE